MQSACNLLKLMILSINRTSIHYACWNLEKKLFLRHVERCNKQLHAVLMCRLLTPILYQNPYSKPAGRHRLCTNSGHGSGGFWGCKWMECRLCASHIPNRNRTQFSLICTGLLSPWHFPVYVMVTRGNGHKFWQRKSPWSKGKQKSTVGGDEHGTRSAKRLRNLPPWRFPDISQRKSRPTWSNFWLRSPTSSSRHFPKQIFSISMQYLCAGFLPIKRRPVISLSALLCFTWEGKEKRDLRMARAC